jgi:hypothetical protein
VEARRHPLACHLLAAGWILSSTQPQLRLKESTIIQLGLTAIFVVLQSVHSLINIPIFKHIKKLEAQIDVDPALTLAKIYGVSNSRFFWNGIMIGIIALFAGECLSLN